MLSSLAHCICLLLFLHTRSVHILFQIYAENKKISSGSVFFSCNCILHMALSSSWIYVQLQMLLSAWFLESWQWFCPWHKPTQSCLELWQTSLRWPNSWNWSVDWRNSWRPTKMLLRKSSGMTGCAGFASTGKTHKKGQVFCPPGPFAVDLFTLHWPASNKSRIKQ